MNEACWEKFKKNFEGQKIFEIFENALYAHVL